MSLTICINVINCHFSTLILYECVYTMLTVVGIPAANDEQFMRRILDVCCTNSASARTLSEM